MQKKLTESEIQNFRNIVKPYARADAKKVMGQLANTLIPYALLWGAIAVVGRISFWYTIPLIVLAALFLVRVFIMFHDCGHNSFLPTTKANRNLGFWLGILVFTPGEEWWHSHAIHHATSGNLDKRGMGDVMTYTIEEYNQMTPMKQFGYRLFRNPLVMFILGPIYMFFFQHRFPIPNFGPRENKDLILHNIVLAVYLTLMSLIIGWKIFLPAQFLIMWLGGMGGIWLFFVQHQYENVYWARDSQWDYTSSAILGASYYDLPGLIQWFTGNIGFHHIHHLNPKIPNYNLGLCYDANPILQQNQRTITIRESLKLPKLVLIDENSGKMVTFNEIKGMKAQSNLTYS